MTVSADASLGGMICNIAELIVYIQLYCTLSAVLCYAC